MKVHPTIAKAVNRLSAARLAEVETKTSPSHAQVVGSARGPAVRSQTAMGSPKRTRQLTPRFGLTTHRKLWLALYSLSEFSPERFATDPDGELQKLRSHLANAPDISALLDRVPLVDPAGYRDATRETRQWLRARPNDFEGLLVRLRDKARRSIAKHSTKAQGQFTEGDVGALLHCLRSSGVQERWVRDAINQLQAQQVEGTPAEQQHATEVLRRVAQAIAGLGRGRTRTTTDTQRRVTRRAAATRSRAIRRLMEKYEKHRATLGHADVVKQVTMEFEQKSRIRTAREREHVLRAFRRRVARRS